MGEPVADVVGAAGAGRIKGAAFREFIVWYRRKVGDERFYGLLARMPHALRDELPVEQDALGVRASRWYPAETVHALLDLLVGDQSPTQRRVIALQASTHVMDTTLRGVFRILFEWMATPERYARHCQRLWAAYYDSGTITVEPDRDGLGCMSEVSGWDAHHDFACELNRGGAIAIYQAMGCRDVGCIRLACVGEGDPTCRFSLTWQGEDGR